MVADTDGTFSASERLCKFALAGHRWCRSRSGGILRFRSLEEPRQRSPPRQRADNAFSLDRGDIVTAGPFEIGNFDGTVSLTSAVVGTTFEFGQLSNLTVGYATPLTGGVGRQYDGALRIMYSRVLGR